MARFINIDGKLINMYHVCRVEQFTGTEDEPDYYAVQLFTKEDYLIATVEGDNARHLYQWLLYECEASFPLEPLFKAGDAIYLPSLYRNVIVTKVVDMGLDGTQYHYQFIDEYDVINTGWTKTPQRPKKFAF